MPAGSTIQSAVMTLTVKSGGAAAARAHQPVPGDELLDAGGGDLERAPHRHQLDVGRRRSRTARAGPKRSQHRRRARQLRRDRTRSRRGQRQDIVALHAGRARRSRRLDRRFRRGSTSRRKRSIRRSGRSCAWSTAAPPRPRRRRRQRSRRPPRLRVPVTLDKAGLSVGSTEANWIINVTTAATCAWTATSDAAWLVVKSTVADAGGRQRLREGSRDRQHRVAVQAHRPFLRQRCRLHRDPGRLRHGLHDGHDADHRPGHRAAAAPAPHVVRSRCCSTTRITAATAATASTAWTGSPTGS